MHYNAVEQYYKLKSHFSFKMSFIPVTAKLNFHAILLHYSVLHDLSEIDLTC